jgi:Fe-S cluster assembly protein SufB
MSKDNQILEEFTSKEYEHGWSVNYEADEAPIGLNEDIIKWISTKKEEPQWLLDWRLKAFRNWVKMTEPVWANVHYPHIDLQSLRYYSAPKQQKSPKTWMKWTLNCYRSTKGWAFP